MGWWVLRKKWNLNPTNKWQIQQINEICFKQVKRCGWFNNHRNIWVQTWSRACQRKWCKSGASWIRTEVTGWPGTMRLNIWWRNKKILNDLGSRRLLIITYLCKKIPTCNELIWKTLRRWFSILESLSCRWTYWKVMNDADKSFCNFWSVGIG